MRVILNTTRLLADHRFLTLNKEQIIALLRIADYFGNDDGAPILIDMETLSEMCLCSLNDIMVLSQKGLITISDYEIELSSKSFQFFKNNLKNVKKCLDKKTKPVIVLEPEIVVKPINKKSKTNNEWLKILELYNSTFKNHQYVTKLSFLDDKRAFKVKEAYEIIKKMQDPIDGSFYEFDDVYDFAEKYLTMMVAPRQGFINSWDWNGKKCKFDFDYFFRRQTILNILEKDMYKN